MIEQFYLVRCNGRFETCAFGKQKVLEEFPELAHIPDSSRLTADYYEASFSCYREITQDEIGNARKNGIEIVPVRVKDLSKINGERRL